MAAVAARTDGDQATVVCPVVLIREIVTNTGRWSVLRMARDADAFVCLCKPRHWPVVSALRRGDWVAVSGRWSRRDPRDGGWTLLAVTVAHVPTPSSGMTLPDAMTPGSPVAPELLTRYFTARWQPNGQPAYTGAMFERLGGGGDRTEVADRFTAEDIVAVSMLSVDVPARASLMILGADAAVLSRLLAAIPADLDMVDADGSHIGSSSPADELWHHLVAYDDVGWVTAGKLIARKRPRLVPVYDSVVKTVLGYTGGSFWLDLREQLRAQDRRLHDWLCQARGLAGLSEEISALRVFDVLAWMTGKEALAASSIDST
jgi:hypothetical protein